MALRQTYCNILNDPVLAANIITTFTGPQNVIMTTGNAAYVAQPCIIPVNYLKTGTIIRTQASGTMANSSTTPTMAFGVYYGTTALAVSAATAETSAATVQCPWEFNTVTIIRSTIVPSAVVTMTTGWVLFGSSLTAVTTLPVPSIARATVNLDNTAAQEWTVKATCGTSLAANTLTMHTMTIEELTQI